MMNLTELEFNESVLVLAHQPRKAEVLRQIGVDAGFQCRTINSIGQLCGAISRTEAAVGLVTQEVLIDGQIHQLAEALQDQPPWSEFPLLIVASPASRSALEPIPELKGLRNATVLERPLRFGMLANALFAALHTRRRQYLSHASKEHALLVRHLRSAQQQLEQAHRRTSDILESIQDVFFSVDRDWLFTYVNKWAEGAWGGPATALLGTSFWDRFPQMVGSYAHEHMVWTMESRKPVQFETFSVVENKWLGVRVYPSADGGLSVYSRDVSLRRRLEVDLRESEERFRVLSQAAVEGVVIHDNRQILDVNDQFASLFGYEPNGMRGLNVLDLLVPEVRELARRSLSASTHPYASVGLRKDGTRFPVEFSGRRIEFRGRPAQVGIVRDLTMQREAERAIRITAEAARIEQERARLEAVLVSLNEGIVLVSTLGEVLYMNPSANRLLGEDRPKLSATERVALEDAFELRTLEDRAMPKEEWPIYRTLRGETFSGLELCIRRSDMSLEWSGSFSGTPVLDEEGRMLFALISFRDVTAEHLAARDIQNANASLRELSGQLLRSQDEERKRIAREMHDGALQVITALSLNLMTIRQSMLPPPSGQLLALLNETDQMIKQSHSELRTLSFLLYPPDLQEAGLAVALRSWANGFSSRTPVHVKVEISDPGRLHADIETALFRITQESLANVQRHSGSSTAVLRLFTLDNSIVLEIQDAGRGLAATEALPQMQPARMGVGVLGMRERARQLGGSLEIISNHTGTTVRAVLPKGAP